VNNNDTIRRSLRKLKAGVEFSTSWLIRDSNCPVGSVSNFLSGLKKAGVVENVGRGAWRLLSEVPEPRKRGGLRERPAREPSQPRQQFGDGRVSEERTEQLRAEARRAAPLVQPELPESMLGKHQPLVFPKSARGTRSTDVVDRIFGAPKGRIYSLMDLEQHQNSGPQVTALVRSGHLSYLGQGYVRVEKEIIDDPRLRAGFARMYSGEIPNLDKLARDMAEE
jgi:hypothetical protein